ncbi:MAG TPA: ATP-binding protein [Thermoanaerobaculia bacterium]|nr:ATP-binding protein [Thermoanaerobaculia bacterium]
MSWLLARVFDGLLELSGETVFKAIVRKLFSVVPGERSLRIRRVLQRARRRLNDSRDIIPFGQDTLHALDRRRSEESLLVTPLIAFLFERGVLPNDEDVSRLVQRAWNRRCAVRTTDKHELFDPTNERASATIALFSTLLYQELVGEFKELAELTKVRAAQQQLATEVSAPPDFAAAETFRSRVHSQTATFHVPLLGIDVPAHLAFSTVVARIADEDEDEDAEREREPTSPSSTLAEYHEPVSRQSRREIDAVDLLTRFGRVVVAGGPGAGKSTLCVKVANALAARSRIVFQVRAKTLRDRPEDEPLDSTLRRVAASVVDSTTESLKPDVVIIDGLDEADPRRGETARLIVRWAEDHPDALVLVTTRRVGHYSSLLPGFMHADLPHLERGEFFKTAWSILEIILSDFEKRKVWFQQIVDSVESESSGRVEALGRRNPLFLTFMLLLLSRGEGLSGTRAQILEWLLDAVLQRSAETGSPERVGAASAMRVASHVAFASIDRSGANERELVQYAAARLAQSDGRPLASAENDVERVLRDWEARRVVERVTSGVYETYTFVHLAIAEYLASRDIVAMNDTTLHAWLVRACHVPKWREPIVLAASSDVDRMVMLMLESDAIDPVNVAPIVATAAVIEARGAQAETLRSLIEILKARSLSPIESVTLESASAMGDLVPYARAEVCAVAKELRTSSQLATRVAGIALAAISASTDVTPDEAREFFSTTTVGIAGRTKRSSHA